MIMMVMMIKPKWLSQGFLGYHFGYVGGPFGADPRVDLELFWFLAAPVVEFLDDVYIRNSN